jgi:ATP adenylyltransferase
MSLERLWAGWRSSYVDGVANVEPSDDGCVFCALAGDDDDHAQVVGRNPLAFAALNIFPYTSGHLLVMPNRHVADLAALTDEEATALMALTRQATTAVQQAYNVDGINVGINLGKAAGAGVPGHLHVHVVPRWSGDTNFMTAVAETRVLPESLPQTYERLHEAWPT